MLELLLGSESAYVRDIVTEELAKGLDAYWRLSADDALDAVRANLVTLLGVRRLSSFSNVSPLVWLLRAQYFGV